MQPPTSLTDLTLTIVADASAAISITASALASLISIRRITWMNMR